MNEPENPWKEAVLDHLAICCMDASLDEAPYHIINRILNWHVAVATDPAVNGGFKLVPVDATNVSHCHIPPKGWWCSREEGHEGPCAARPATFSKRLYWSIRLRSLDVWKRIPS